MEREIVEETGLNVNLVLIAVGLFGMGMVALALVLAQIATGLMVGTVCVGVGLGVMFGGRGVAMVVEARGRADAARLSAQRPLALSAPPRRVLVAENRRESAPNR